MPWWRYVLPPGIGTHALPVACSWRLVFFSLRYLPCNQIFIRLPYAGVPQRTRLLSSKANFFQPPPNHNSLPIPPHQEERLWPAENLPSPMSTSTIAVGPCAGSSPTCCATSDFCSER